MQGVFYFAVIRLFRDGRSNFELRAKMWRSLENSRVLRQNSDIILQNQSASSPRIADGKTHPIKARGLALLRSVCGPVFALSCCNPHSILAAWLLLSESSYLNV